MDPYGKNLLGDAIKIMEPRLGKDRGKTARISEMGSCALILTLTQVKDAVTDKSLEEIIKRLDTIWNVSACICCIHINEDAQYLGGGIGNCWFLIKIPGCSASEPVVSRER